MSLDFIFLQGYSGTRRASYDCRSRFYLNIISFLFAIRRRIAGTLLLRDSQSTCFQRFLHRFEKPFFAKKYGAIIQIEKSSKRLRLVTEFGGVPLHPSLAGPIDSKASTVIECCGDPLAPSQVD